MADIERKPIRFCAAHEVEMVDPGERSCLGSELGTPCEGAEVEYVPISQLQGAVGAARALAQWTQHRPACARSKMTANACTCGLQEAWLAIDVSAGRR